MRKSFLIVLVFIVLLGVFLIGYELSRPKNILKYNGIQIYDAIRAYNYLSYHGFDVTTTVIGNDYSGRVELKGVIVETNSGSFILRTKEGYRTIEGPMGTQDVKAEEIFFNTSSIISVEAGYPSVGDLKSFLELTKKFERFGGMFAVNTIEPLTPVFVQRIRNLDEKFYEPPNIKVEAFESGFILKTETPLKTENLIKMLEEVDEKLRVDKFESNYVLFYVGVDNEYDADKIKEDLQKDGALVRTYRADKV